MVDNKNSSIKVCGSIEFQVSQLSDEIKNLTEHLKTFKKDNHSKYGLIKKVSRRKAFLKYLKSKGKSRDKIVI
ncbi:MAG TPA: 30S ribosomal protein S15 [Candidatus Azoamicus sp.]